MLKNKLFMTSALIAVFVSGNSYAATIGGSKTLARSIAQALEQQNTDGFNIGSITIGTGIDETNGRSDVLNFDNAETKTQFVKMTDVQLPNKIEVAKGDDISQADSFKAGLALGILNNKINEMGGQIKDGYLVAGDDGLVIDGKYGYMVASLIDNNQDKLQQLAEGSNVITPERINYIKSETKNLGETNRLKFNVDDFTMTGGNLVVKNGITMKADQVNVTDGKVNVVASDISNDIVADTLIMSGGKLNIEEGAKIVATGKTMNVESTASVINNGDLKIEYKNAVINSGISGTGKLTIADGATLNIGDATVEQKTVALDGNMIANLSDRGDKAIVTAEEFDGDGKLSLIAKGEGTYKVFGDYTNVTFKGEKEVKVDSALYNMDWADDDKTVTLGMKSVEDIAGDNNLSAAASQTVMNLVMADSDKLNDFGIRVQESLASGDAASVEKAHKAINPVDASVVQSVATHVQGTVAKLAANRMSMPTFTGRAGGDFDLTAGSVWAQGLFNKSKKNGEFNGYTRGVAAGIDGTINRAFTIGAGYAFNHSDIDLDSRDTEIDSNTIFVYGQYKPSAWYANATLNYTMSDYTESGSALGVAIDSDYKINAFGGQVMTGYDFANGLTPEVGVRYLHVDGDTYTNSLGIRNKIDDADYLTAILGGKYAKVFAVSRDLSLRPEVRLAAKYDMMSDEYNTAVAMPGINSYGVRADRLNRFGGEAGVGVTMSYQGVDLSLTYDIEVRQDYTSQTGMVKAKYNF